MLIKVKRRPIELTVNVDILNNMLSFSLLPSQQEMWLLSQDPKRSIACHALGVYVIKGNIDPAQFRNSLLLLIDRHESLRASFFIEHDEIKQIIRDHTEIDFHYQNICDEINKNNLINDLIDNVALRQFNLFEGPLFRIRLLQIAKDEYQLILVIHHIIFDGYSFGIFIKDIFAIYYGQQLPAIQVSYRNYVINRNILLKSANIQKKAEYWIREFTALPQSLELPYDCLRPNPQTYDGSRFHFALTAIQTARIKKIVMVEKTTLLVFLLSIFNTFLYKISQQTDIVVGVPLSGRNVENNNLIGMFVNAVPVRSTVNANLSFKEYLYYLTRVVIDAYRHRNFSLNQLIDRTILKRDLSRNPFFDVMLILHDNFRHFQMSDISIHYQNFEKKTSRYDLVLNVIDDDGKYEFMLEYNPNLFKSETIEYWANGLLTIIEKLTTDTQIKLKDVVVFDYSCQKTSLPTPINNKYKYFDNQEINQSISARFEAQVKKYPNQVAIQQAEDRITYWNLNKASANLAASILTHHTKLMSSNIALLLTDGKQAVIGMLGVLKTGNAYVPLDPLFPLSRLSYILQDTGCNLIVADPETINLAKTICAEAAHISIINIAEITDALPITEVATIDAHSPAYILYTSGSTGEPKGVIQSHRNVLHFIRVYTNNLKISHNDHLSLLPSYSFDSAVMDIFGALLNGATLYPYDIKKQGLANLAEWLINHQISIVHTVPTVYRHFVAELAKTQHRFKAVRLVVLGGEAVYKIDFENFKMYFPENSILVNGYGPTESTITLQNFLNHASSVSGRNIPIGYPVAETALYLLDEHDEILTDVYQIGELVYKSDYLALGYLNKPGQTAAAFTTDPVTKQGRVYRSGDFGKLMPTGAIEFVSRKDNQVKLRGYRIELIEVEEALRSFELIDDCLVILKIINDSDQRLIAYYTASEAISTLLVRKYLGQRLPAHFVPTLYIRLEVIPKTASGKSNRKYLESLPVDNLIHQHFIPPRTDFEIKLAAIWKEVLSIEKVSVYDDFFSLGGSSLIAIKAISLIKSRLGITLTIMDFINQPLSNIALKYEQEYSS